MRLRAALVRFWGLGTALLAGAVLLVVPASTSASPAPVPMGVAWPNARRAVTAATLPDGAGYQPVIFVDARTSVGTAPAKDGKSLRLLIVGAGTPARELRSLPYGRGPSFQAFAVDGDVLIWAQGELGKIQLWRAGLTDREPPRQLTADAGDASFYGSQHDLTVAAGSVHWAVTGQDATEVRSIAVAGGPVRTRAVPGRWALSGWPWLVDGITASGGTTQLRNLDTGEVRPVGGAGARSVTQCSPVWCRVARLTRDGGDRLDLMRPDGGDRTQVAGDTAQTVIADVAPLDRFEVFAKVGPQSDLTGNVQLLAFETATRRTVEVSPDASRVSYRNGVLSWATGSLETFIWHALDLRTV